MCIRDSAKIAAMPIQSWRYKAELSRAVHVGPVAQDFYAAFGLGDDDRRITTVDIDGINMLAIQALAERTDALAQKTRELEAVQQRLAQLEAAIVQIRAQLER